ncbi:hypothetical protein PGT21_024618 [Puccinia graminis f. sp. tritici]|uniref:Uncharacterized protein n=1 Tax=Puccinia graminis f. sp. tritici TaxID=56615 RepID=A0A5B0QNG4_PUCGR|nr:hypothetical protein PGT21_024618 [Puccinia graminis f. sp. tritici]
MPTQVVNACLETLQANIRRGPMICALVPPHPIPAEMGGARYLFNAVEVRLS